MKCARIISALGLCLTVATPLTYAGELNGRIVLSKKLSKRQVRLPAYQMRGAMVAEDREDPAGELGAIAVFLEGELPPGGKAIRAELEQRGQRFEPQLLLIPVGSSVSFPNFDPIFHNVFSLSSARKFDLGYYPAGQTRIVRFDEPGIVQVYCHLHPDMYAAVVVTPNRWYTTPESDGSFTLRDIPAGTYRLVAWHMKAGFSRTEVQIGTAGSTEEVVEIPSHDTEHGR